MNDAFEIYGEAMNFGADLGYEIPAGVHPIIEKIYAGKAAEIVMKRADAEIFMVVAYLGRSDTPLLPCSALHGLLRMASVPGVRDILIVADRDFSYEAQRLLRRLPPEVRVRVRVWIENIKRLGEQTM